jgi:hypothetical protein
MRTVLIGLAIAVALWLVAIGVLVLIAVGVLIATVRPGSADTGAR